MFGSSCKVEAEPQGRSLAHHLFAHLPSTGYAGARMEHGRIRGSGMGDLIDLKTRITRVLEGETPDIDTFLLEEGLELLADFRSIDDADVRKSIMQMVAKIATALRAR
ncbi:MAG: hypothetical protein OTI36_04455 [Beijerinckiaceae bacterium]|nr:hypothetical protein [Beijerinckiaceae bacterium]